MERREGFTLLEFIVVVAVAAILAVIAVPAFTGTVQNARLSAASDNLMHALQLARAEAATRGLRVTLCKSADGARCTDDGGYGQGWMLFVDDNGNADADTGEAVLRVAGTQPVAITGNTPVQRYVSYVPQGWTRLASGGLQMGTLTLCDGDQARRVVISRTGRARSETGTCP